MTLNCLSYLLSAGTGSAGGGHRTTYGSLFFHFIQWVPEIKQVGVTRLGSKDLLLTGFHFWVFETGLTIGVQVGLELRVFLPQPLQGWD